MEEYSTDTKTSKNKLFIAELNIEISNKNFLSFDFL